MELHIHMHEHRTLGYVENIGRIERQSREITQSTQNSTRSTAYRPDKQHNAHVYMKFGIFGGLINPGLLVYTTGMFEFT